MSGGGFLDGGTPPNIVAFVLATPAGRALFGEGWDTHDVRAAPSGIKRLRHAARGWRTYEYAAFQCNEDPAVKLTVYTPVET